MASVSVFVDDAVLGRFPPVCAKTGTPADVLVRVDKTRGAFGLAVLLLLLGPVGWIVFLVLAVTRTREVLTVNLPMSHAAVARERWWTRAPWLAGAVAFALLLATALRLEPLPPEVWLVGALLGLVATVVLSVVLGFVRVGIALDASHRWVTLSGVHPAFAAAVSGVQHPLRERISG